jgi:hypothetical protein
MGLGEKAIAWQNVERMIKRLLRQTLCAFLVFSLVCVVSVFVTRINKFETKKNVPGVDLIAAWLSLTCETRYQA